jgi:ActR/RegA family two-component response regulator
MIYRASGLLAARSSKPDAQQLSCQINMPYSALIIDDEELTLRTISRGLRQEGFEVFTALSGEDG